MIIDVKVRAEWRGRATTVADEQQLTFVVQVDSASTVATLLSVIKRHYLDLRRGINGNESPLNEKSVRSDVLVNGVSLSQTASDTTIGRAGVKHGCTLHMLISDLSSTTDLSTMARGGTQAPLLDIENDQREVAQGRAIGHSRGRLVAGLFLLLVYLFLVGFLMLVADVCRRAYNIEHGGGAWTVVAVCMAWTFALVMICAFFLYTTQKLDDWPSRDRWWDSGALPVNRTWWSVLAWIVCVVCIFTLGLWAGELLSLEHWVKEVPTLQQVDVRQAAPLGSRSYVFQEQTAVDISRGVSLAVVSKKTSAVYCLAPIVYNSGVDPQMAIYYWAIGKDCCTSTIAPVFDCQWGNPPNYKQGILDPALALDGRDMPTSKTENPFVKLRTKAIQTFNLTTSASAPAFVSWVKDIDQSLAERSNKGRSITYVFTFGWPVLFFLGIVGAAVGSLCLRTRGSRSYSQF